MSIRRDDFAVGVYYYNQQYTPQQVTDYIANTSGVGFADPQGIQALIQESQGKFQSSVKTHKLTMEQMLQAETSPAGKELAELTLSHCDKTISLIVDGGHRSGILI